MGQVISATGPAPAPVASSAAPWDAFGGAMASDGFNGRLSMLDVVTLIAIISWHQVHCSVHGE